MFAEVKDGANPVLFTLTVLVPLTNEHDAEGCRHEDFHAVL